MTPAEFSYKEWWESRNGIAMSIHSAHRIPYVEGYEAGIKDMKDSIVALISPCLDRQPDLQKVITAIEDL